MGCHPSKISKIEHGSQLPSATDIRVWCEHCGTPEETADLVASLRAVEGMYVEWRQLARGGLRPWQESYGRAEERARQFRIYEPGVIPGLFQTSAYATARMGRIIQFSGVRDDLEKAVAARMARQRLLGGAGRRFAVVLEEWALYSRIGSREMMVGQLGHLLNLATQPMVSLGIVRLESDRTMWSSPGFWIFDEERVVMETPTAELTITQPREIAVYVRVFSELASMAVYGSAARSLIVKAIEAIGH
jgi:uncharacterized protein DUF5753